MLKIQLASKNVLKAVRAKDADWGRQILVSEAEWKQIGDIMIESRDSSAGGVNIDDNIVVGITKSLEQCDQLGVLSSLTRILEILTELYPDNIYSIPVISDVTLAVLRKDNKLLRRAGLSWYAIALRAHQKAQLKSAYDYCLQNDGELLHKLLGSASPAAVAAVIFSSSQDWKTFLHIKDSEEEVTSVIEALPSWKSIADALPKTQTKDATSSGRSKMNTLFTKLSESKESITHCHLLLEAYQKSYSKKVSDDRVVGSEYSRELMKLFLLLAITILSCKKSDSNIKAEALLKAISAVKESYHSQTDVLYHHGFGFRILTHVAQELLSICNDQNSHLVLQCSLLLHSMYHKITEPFHTELLTLALVPPVGSKNTNREGFAQMLVTAVLDSYTQMQSLDQVVEALCKNESLFKESEPPKWFTDVMHAYLPKMLDAMPTAKVILEYVCKYGSNEGAVKTRCVPTLSKVASGLPINETSAVSSAMWIDTLVSFAYSILVEMFGSIKNNTTLGSALHLYWVAQQVLDSAAGYFFTTDIFKWSEKSTAAFTLAAKLPHKDESNSSVPDLPLVFFPGCATVYSIPEILNFAGENPTKSVEAVMIRLIHQRVMRIIQHYEILKCSSGAITGDKETEKSLSRMKKQIKRLTGVMLNMWCSLLKSAEREDVDVIINVNEIPTCQNAACSVTVVLAPDLSRFSEYGEAAILSVIMKYLMSISSIPSATVKTPAPGQNAEETMWRCRSLFSCFDKVISNPNQGTPRSAAAHIITNSNDAFESAKLTNAIIVAATDLLTSTNPTHVTAATAWVLRIPLDVLPVVDTTKFLPAIADAESKEKKIRIKAILRSVLSHICRRSPGWCSEYGGELKRLLADCTGGGDKEIVLSVPTTRLAMEVMSCGERTEELCLEIANNPQVGKLTVSKQLIPAVILQKLSPGEQPYTLAAEVIDIRKKMKKRGRKSEATNENYDLIGRHIIINKKSSNLEIGVKLLLLRKEQVICSDLSQEALQIILKRFEETSAPTESLIWLTAISLDTVLPSLAGSGSKSHEKIAGEFLTSVIRKIMRTTEAQLQWNPRQNNSSATLLSLVLPRISLLTKTRGPVLTSIFTECQDVISEKVSGVSISGVCSVLSSLLITCSTECMSDLKSLHGVLVAALVKFHCCLLSSKQNDIQKCPSLGSLVAVICLVEKVALPASAMPIILALPAAILRDTTQGEDFTLRFAVADNILRNLLLHRAGAISGHWGEYVHAVGDLIDAFLKSENASPQLDTEGICSIVRLLELLAGAKKRVGIPDSVREIIGFHGTTLIHRFLNSVITYSDSSNANNRDLARGFSSAMSLCGKRTFSTVYANMPQSYRIVASSFHMQWQASRFQGKT